MSVRQDAYRLLQEEKAKLLSQGKTTRSLEIEVDDYRLPLVQRYAAGRTLRYLLGLKGILGEE